MYYDNTREIFLLWLYYLSIRCTPQTVFTLSLNLEY